MPRLLTAMCPDGKYRGCDYLGCDRRSTTGKCGNDPEFMRWLKAHLGDLFEIELSKEPWWCMLCGKGGNYEGERPDHYWVPPKDHVCKPKKWEGPIGISI